MTASLLAHHTRGGETLATLAHSHTPHRSLQQRLDALKRANDIRIRRAQLKRDLKDARVSLLDVIADPPDCAATAKVLEVLLAAPRIGRVKAERILRRTQVSPSKTVAGLSARQRDAVCLEIVERGLGARRAG